MKLFFVFSALMSGLLLYSYANGYLPHYLVSVDGGVITIAKDDLNPQALPLPLAQDDQTIDSILDSTPATVEAPQKVQKCLDPSGRFTYQAASCESTALKQVKTLTPQDGVISSPHTYQYKNHVQPQQQQQYTAPVVASLGITTTTKQRDVNRCAALDRQRENVKSQQRIRSTQWLRDEYTRLSIEWQADCLG